MTTAQKLSCFLITGYILQMSGILVALLTDHWAGEDEFHFGVLKYCVDNTSSCQEVRDKLHFIEGNLLCDFFAIYFQHACSSTQKSLLRKKLHYLNLIFFYFYKRKILSLIKLEKKNPDEIFYKG